MQSISLSLDEKPTIENLPVLACGARVVTRFAPSPSGFLHVGHAFAAWVAWDMARRLGGVMRLRLEDIDPARCRPAFADAIMEDVAWLGLTWDGPVMVQSERMDAYATALETLDQRGLLYPCFCTRQDIAAEITAAGGAPQGPEGPVYPGLCRMLDRAAQQARLAAGEPYALRLHVAKALAQRGLAPDHPAAAYGDVVLARKDVRTSYHLAVVVDDAVQGISVVTRGHDLAPAAPLHALLAALLSLPVPYVVHHALVVDQTGRRLAKRDKDLTIASLRAAGWSPEAVLHLARHGSAPYMT